MLHSRIDARELDRLAERLRIYSRVYGKKCYQSVIVPCYHPAVVNT